MPVISEKTVKYKLTIGFLLVIVLFVSFGIISLWEVHTVGSLTKMIYEHPLVVSNAALNAAINMTKMHRSMKDVALSNSLNELNKASNEVNKFEQLVYEQLDIIREMIIGAEGKNLEKRTRQLFSDWKPIREEVFILFNSGRRDEAALVTKGKGADHVAKLEEKMLELTSYARKKADGFMQLSEKSQSKVENISVLLVLGGIFLSVFIAFFTVRHVLKVEKALLNERNELQKALSEIKTLSGLLPICASCKKIRDDKGYWNQIELYIRDHTEAEFSHGLCPICAENLYGDLINEQN
jgi:Four helix bundle sensory module for signal transduction